MNLYLRDPQLPQADEVRRLVDELAARLEELEHERHQLEDYRDRYIDLYDFAPLGYASLDEEGYIQEINLAGAQLLGMDRHSLTGYPFVDYVGADDIQAFRSHVRKCIEERTEVTSEVHLIVQGGGSRTVQLRSIPIEDRKHEIILCKTAIADISDTKQVEEALRTSEERLRMAVDATGLGTWDYDLVASRITWSPECKRMFGVGPEIDVDYQGFLALVHAEDRQRVDISVQQATTANGTGEYHTQYRIVQSNGNVRWLDSNGRAHFREVEGTRRAIRFIGTVLDITEPKRSEEAIRESEARHRAILESSVDAIITIDHHGIIETVNPATQRLFGYVPEELIGNNVSMLMPSPHREMHDTYLANYMRTGQRKIIGIGREVVARRKDGTNFPIDLSVSEMNVGGRKMFTGLVHDITDRKRAEEWLRKSRDELETSVQQRTAELTAANQQLKYERYLFDMLMDHLPNSIHFKDADGRFIRVNKAMAAACRLANSDEAIGRTDLDFFAPEDANAAAADEEEIRRTGQAMVDKEEHERLLDGHSRWVSTTKMPLYNEAGKIVGTFGVSRDVTDRRRAAEALRSAKEAAEAASRAKSTFLANMSHEIRTPMNAVIGMTELVLDTPLSPRQREYLTVVEESAESLLAIINDILDFSKIEAGRFSLDSAPFDVREHLGDTMKTLALRADRKGIELVCRIHPEVPDVVVGDAARLRQVVINLVGNAIKFTEVGEVVVDLEHDVLSSEEVSLHFKVTDTGIGIPAEKQATVFEAFEQGDGTISRRYGGTGLGLAISSRLVNMMNGRIWVESEVGRGSTFHFSARVGLLASEPPTAPRQRSMVLRGTKVLVVDDNATNRMILEEMLRNWMLQPTVVPTAEEAINLLRQAHDAKAPFRLVLTDAHMPVMDGFSLAERVKEDDQLGSTVIMMLTSSDQSGDTVRCQDFGIAAYLLKPVKQSELFDAIVLALGVGESPSEARPRKGPRVHLRPLRILLAEDSLVNQKVVVTMLEKEGHMLTVANNGRAALGFLSSEKFDLVLMDVQMPEMDGLEATAAIRGQERQAGTHVPIIAMTAHALKGDRERCLEAGMDEYIAKPIHLRELMETIERTLGNSAAAGEPSDSSPPQAEVMDWDELLKTAKGDRDAVEAIISAAREEVPRLRAAIRDAMAAGDPAAVRLAAHTLKGSVQYFGASRLFGLARELERNGREGDLQSARVVLPQLEAELARFADVLAKHQSGECDYD